MHEHDLDLIAALAEGSLDDERAARALVESCSECSAAYQGQVRVLQLLADTPAVAMTDLEKAALHRDLWTELRNQQSGRAPTPWWQRWSFVAAGLFVVVGLAAVLGGLTQMGGDTAAGTTLSGAFAADAPTEDNAVSPQAVDEADGGGAESVTTAAAEETLPLPFAALADEARTSLRTTGQAESQDLSGEAERCLEQHDLTDQVVADELQLDQRYLLVMPRAAGERAPVTFIALDDCEVVFVDE